MCLYIYSINEFQHLMEEQPLCLQMQTQTLVKKSSVQYLDRKGNGTYKCLLPCSVHLITGMNISTLPGSCCNYFILCWNSIQYKFLSLLFPSPWLLNEQWFRLFVVPLLPVFLHGRNAERCFSIWSIFPAPSIFLRLFQVKKTSGDSYILYD